jgi:hypothetical protein
MGQKQQGHLPATDLAHASSLLQGSRSRMSRSVGIGTASKRPLLQAEYSVVTPS